MDSRALLPPVVGLDGDFGIDEAVIAPGSATRLVGRQKQTVDHLHGGAMLVSMVAPKWLKTRQVVTLPSLVTVVWAA